jgi:membrane fusion protein, multidrug efflux system
MKIELPGRRTMLVLLAVVLAAAGWRILGGRAVVTTARVTVGDAAQVVYATGVVEPVVWSKVSSLMRKRIVEICRCEGKQVTKGEVLVRLDDVEERAALAEIIARRDRLKEDVERIRGLVERNVSSRVAFEEKVTQLREIEARVAAQQDRIVHLELRAPMDGVVLRRDGEVGEIAGTGNADVIFWVGQPKPLRIVADINEDDIVRVRPGQKVLLRHESQGGKPLEAAVESVTPKGDTATKTFRAYFSLPEDTPLRIGMSVEANVVVREVKGVLLVPAEAVIAGKVMVVEDGVVRSVAIKTGVTGARMVEAVEGLAKDQVVVSPAKSDLTSGTRVRVVPSSGSVGSGK